MLTPADLTRVLPTLPLVEEEGVFWRTVPEQHLKGPPPGAPAASPPQPLWPGGGAMRGARYTRIGGCNALYLAPDGATALAEVEAVLFDPAGGVQPGDEHDPLLVFAVRVRLPRVLNVCDAAIQAALGTSETELKSPWLRAQERHRLGRGPLPPTQALGEAACAARGILALRYPSYRHHGVENLVVFTDHLAALGGAVVLIDRSGRYRQSLP